MMANFTPAGMLAVPLVLLAGSLAPTAAPAPPAGDERVELEVAGVLPMPEGTAGILVLREKGKETLLPLMVPDGRELAPDGPAEGGLLGRAIAALGARVAEVEIEQTEEIASGARVHLTQGDKQVDVRGVPSESVALALAAKAPIAARFILDAVNKGLQMTVGEGQILEATLFGLVASTDDMREGTKAFLEKRKPAFKNA